MTDAKAQMLATQIKQAAQILHGTMDGVTPEIAHHQPGGRAHSIAANVAHVITSLDVIVNSVLQPGKPLSTTMETGFSSPAPTGEDTFNWHEWGTSLTLDLGTFMGYADEVFKSVYAYMDTLTDNDLDTVHQTFIGERTTFDMLNGAVLNNLTMHAGEISALKGQHNLKGYPF